MFLRAHRPISLKKRVCERFAKGLLNLIVRKKALDHYFKKEEKKNSKNLLIISSKKNRKKPLLFRMAGL